jgi:hypothetical protein
MDPTKDNVDEQMAELREALKEINLTPEDLTITNSGAVSGTHGYESILSNSAADTITIGGFGGYNNTVYGGGYNTMAGAVGTYSNAGPYTISTSSPSNSPWMTQNSLSAPKIQLNGEGADVEVNGWSLVDAVKRIEERLNLLQPNPKLEAEWHELKQLGDQYRALEEKLKEQTEMWAKLKSMPPPPLT